MVEIMIHILYFIFAILLFYLMNWLGKHSYTLGYQSLSVFQLGDTNAGYNFVFRFFTPQVYIFLIAVASVALGVSVVASDLYFIVLYSFFIRWVYLILFDRILLVSWGYQFLMCVVVTAFSYWLCINVLKNPSVYIPKVNDLSKEIWIAVFAYVYAVMNNMDFGSMR